MAAASTITIEVMKLPKRLILLEEMTRHGWRTQTGLFIGYKTLKNQRNPALYLHRVRKAQERSQFNTYYNTWIYRKRRGW